MALQSNVDSAFVQELEKSPVVVNHHSLSEIRIALDDVIVKYLNEAAAWSQCHKQMDRYLIVQFVLNIIGGITAAYSYTTPFGEARFFVGIACACYFLLSLFWTICFFFFEKSELYRGFKIIKGKKATLSVNTNMKAPSTLYHVFLSINDAPPSDYAKPVEAWFDLTGKLVADRFEKDVKQWLDLVQKKEN